MSKSYEGGGMESNIQKKEKLLNLDGKRGYEVVWIEMVP